MIQPSPSLAIAATAMVVEPATLTSMQAPESGGFAALLAITTANAVDPANTVSPAAEAPTSAELAVAAPAMPGKTLPSDLPLADLPLPVSVGSAEQVVGTESDDAPLKASKDRTAHSGSVRIENFDPAVTLVPGDLVSPKVDANGLEPLAEALQPQPIAPQLLNLPAPTPSEWAGEQPQSRPKSHPALVSQAIAAQVAPRTAVAELVKSAGKETGGHSNGPAALISPEALPANAALPAQVSIAPPTRAIPAEQVRIELALPRLVSPASNARTERPQAKALPETASPEFGPQFTTTPDLPHLPLAMPAPAPVRPQDFTALIDRLTMAREAAVPQAVLITVAHQDFGPVRLHFRPEDVGLSVAMSSPDPEFARAAAAAPAPVVPVTHSEQANFAQSRNDTAPAQSGQSGSFAQSRGQTSDRRENQGQPQSNPSPRAEQHRSGPRQGIFA